MSQKIFLSFLGTGNYTPCNYQYKNGPKVKEVEFVQTALTSLFCNAFTAKDKAVIFITQQAKEKNWNRLQAEFEANHLKSPLTAIEIPEGHLEDELWTIFQIVYEQIEQNAHVILDVTHAFRSIPMMGIVLMNYAKFLKNITVDGIYYGAFEALGRPAKVKEMPMEQRNAPVFELTAFDQLQQWSAAADNFVSGGNPRKIAQLLRDWISASERKNKKSRGQDSVSVKTLELADNLDALYNQLSTVRGKEIVSGKTFLNTEKGIEWLTPKLPIPPLKPLLEKMKKQLTGFKKNSPANGLKATRLCLNFGLIQQGITLLQESIVTSIAFKRQELNYNLFEHRKIIRDAILKKGNPDFITKNPNLSDKLLKIAEDIPETTQIAPVYRKLSTARNNINHAEFSTNRTAIDFQKELRESLFTAENILGN